MTSFSSYRCFHVLEQFNQPTLTKDVTISVGDVLSFFIRTISGWGCSFLVLFEARNCSFCTLYEMTLFLTL